LCSKKLNTLFKFDHFFRRTIVANHKSAEKRAKQAEVKRDHNRSRKSLMRTTIKKLRLAIAGGKKAEAQDLLVSTQSIMGKLAKTNTIKAGSAARKTSRLASQVASLK
jgi:small subunit ribosomal protein S20